MTLDDDFVGVRFDVEGEGWVIYLGSAHQEIIDSVDEEVRATGLPYIKATKLSKQECVEAIPRFSLEACLSTLVGNRRVVQSDVHYPRKK